MSQDPVYMFLMVGVGQSNIWYLYLKVYELQSQQSPRASSCGSALDSLSHSSLLSALAFIGKMADDVQGVTGPLAKLEPT